MSFHVLGVTVAGGGPVQCLMGVKVLDDHVSKSWYRVSNRSASNLSRRVWCPPSWGFLTCAVDDEVRGNEGLVTSTHEGRRVQGRANQSTNDENRHEINVCTQKACRRSGSLQTLDVLRSLAPPSVTVDSCGCLGKCGSGPNLVVLPSQLMVSHCSTAVHAARLLEVQCGAADPVTNLKALGLKEQGNQCFQLGDLEQAEKFYSEAIELKPSGGLHFIYGNRSAARLARGDSHGALEDAMQALSIAPLWAGAYLRKADAYVQLGDFQIAQVACSRALQLDPSLRRSKALQAKLKQIEESLELVRVIA